MSISLTSTVEKTVNVSLLVEYLAAAWIRYKVARRVPTLRRSYLLSVPCALVFASAYFGLLVWGEDHTRTLVLRVLQMTVVNPVVWMWPGYLALRDENRRAEHAVEVRRHFDAIQRGEEE